MTSILKVTNPCIHGSRPILTLGEFYKVLDETTDSILYMDHDPWSLAAVGLSLLSLGRTSHCLWQCALAIDVCPFEERPTLLLVFSEAFEQKKLISESYRLAVDANRLCMFLISEGTSLKSTLTKTIDRCQEAARMLKRKEKKSVPRPIPLQESIEVYFKAGLKASNKPHLRRAQSWLEQSTYLAGILDEWSKSKDLDIQDTIISGIFSLVTSLCDQKLIESVVTKKTIIHEIVEAHLIRFPEIDPFSLVADLIKQLLRLRRRSVPKFFALSSLCIKAKTIRAFIQYTDQHHNKAALELNIVSVLIKALRKDFIKHVSLQELKSPKNEVLTEKTLVSLAILQLRFTSGLSYGAFDATLGLQALARIVENQPKVSNDTWLTCQAMSSLGHFSFFTSIQRAKTLEVSTSTGPLFGLHLEKQDLFEAIRKYLFAATMKDPDDPSIVLDCTKIFTLMVFHGGYNLKTFWFFCFLRDYYVTYFQAFPVDYGVSEGPKEPKTTEPWLLGVEEYITSLYAIRETTEKKRMDRMWLEDARSMEEFTLPEAYMYIQDPELMVIPQKPKISRKNLKERVARLRQGRSLLTLWLESYQGYHTPPNVPATVAAALTVPKPILNYYLGCLS